MRLHLGPPIVRLVRDDQLGPLFLEGHPLKTVQNLFTNSSEFSVKLLKMLKCAKMGQNCDVHQIYEVNEVASPKSCSRTLINSGVVHPIFSLGLI